MDRLDYLARIQRGFQIHPVVVLLGPRQAGKTTLARAYVARIDGFRAERNYFDLEDPTDLGRLEAPKLALERLEGIVVVDEVQRSPDLFPLLRTLVDRPHNPARFLILGSASRDLIRQSSETLAGRVSFIEIHPFSGVEVGVKNLDRLWIRGGLPPAYLLESDQAASMWRESYVRTFLERDVPSLGIDVPANALRRLWLMLTHYHGQVINLSEIARSIGVSYKTIDRYIDILAGTFMVRRLAPWYENIGKRQVKRPKVYFRDSGILHQFLGVETRDQLEVHPRLGASWEGFALEEVIRLHGATAEEAFFWAVHEQMELDLLLVRGGKRLGFEFKYADAPKLTCGLIGARDHLGLDQLTVVRPGRGDAPLDEGITVVGLETLLSERRA
ncbi:MAG: ATP-binding protein [Planctomycetes bacterium]|nr:ATP-binding protein [Planctomycetota bacterium]